MGICESTPESQLPAGWKELFHALKLTDREITQLQRMFRKVDMDNSGSVDTVELLTLLDIERTRFTEQIFTLFDSDNSGKVDFREFVMALWNYCTIGEASLDIFTFDLYDRDSSGVLSPGEVSQMLRDIYGRNHVNDAKVKVVDMELQSIDARTSINLPAFRKFTKTHQALLFPAFQLQNQLQRKVLGVAFWHRASNRRVEMCKGNYVTMSTLMQMHLANGMYDRAVSDSNFLRMSSNARLIMKTTGTNHGRQEVEKKQEANHGANRHHGSIVADSGKNVNLNVNGDTYPDRAPKTGNNTNSSHKNGPINSNKHNTNSAPPTPLAYGSFTAPDKKAAIETLSKSKIVKNYLDKKPTASKKGMISNKPRGQPNQSNKGVATDERADKETISSEVKTKPHTEGLPPRRKSITPAS